MKEKVIWVVAVAVIGLVLYGFWLMSVRDFIYALLAFLIFTAMGLGFAADSQEEERQECRSATHPQRRYCTSPN